VPRRKEGPQTRLVACEFESRRALRLHILIAKPAAMRGLRLLAGAAPRRMCGCDPGDPALTRMMHTPVHPSTA